jgi:P-type Mg2+ transporter
MKTMEILSKEGQRKNYIGLPLEDLKAHLDFKPGGLTEAESESRLQQYGFNEISREKPLSPLKRLWINLKNPLVILLSILGIISFLTGDMRSTIVIFVMVILGIFLRYIQEMRADKAAAKLNAMVMTHATVCRDGRDLELPLKMLVPGDVIRLGSGDMVPADVRVLTAKDLFLNQSALTGESTGCLQYLLPGFQRGKRDRHRPGGEHGG